MKTLCMDTAHRNLVIGLYEDNQLLCGISKPSWKRQSETLFPELMELMDQVGWQSEDIEEVVITDGPGSYTGVRIAMSVAKVFCTTREVPLYTISTLQLYAGLHHVSVMLDARSGRAYYGEMNQGNFLQVPCIMTLEAIQASLKAETVIIGDTELIDRPSVTPDYTANFIALRPVWKRIDNVHILVPEYLKDQSAYKVG